MEIASPAVAYIKLNATCRRDRNTCEGLMILEITFNECQYILQILTPSLRSRPDVDLNERIVTAEEAVPAVGKYGDCFTHRYLH